MKKNFTGATRKRRTLHWITGRLRILLQWARIAKNAQKERESLKYHPRIGGRWFVDHSGWFQSACERIPRLRESFLGQTSLGTERKNCITHRCKLLHSTSAEIISVTSKITAYPVADDSNAKSLLSPGRLLLLPLLMIAMQYHCSWVRHHCFSA